MITNEIDIKMNKTLSERASAILRMFSDNKIIELYDEMVDFIYGWQMYVEANGDPGLDKELTEIMLLRTAIALSRIADAHADTFKKVSRHHSRFWEKCESIADQMAEKRNKEIP